MSNINRWRRPESHPTLLRPDEALTFEDKTQTRMTFLDWTTIFVVMFGMLLLYLFASGYWVRYQPWMDTAKRAESAGIGLVEPGGGATPGFYLVKLECIDEKLQVKLECVREAIRLPIMP